MQIHTESVTNLLQKKLNVILKNTRHTKALETELLTWYGKTEKSTRRGWSTASQIIQRGFMLHEKNMSVKTVASNGRWQAHRIRSRDSYECAGTSVSVKLLWKKGHGTMIITWSLALLIANTEDKIFKALNKLKCDKTPDPDNIHPKLLYEAITELVRSLAFSQIYVKVWTVQWQEEGKYHTERIKERSSELQTSVANVCHIVQAVVYL